MELIETQNYVLQVNDDGTTKKHFKKWAKSPFGKLRQYDLDPTTGKESSVEFEPHVLLTSDKTTGEIKQQQSGFIREYELLGPPVHPNPNLEYTHAYLPADFQKEVSVDLIEIDNTGKQTKKGKIKDKRTAYKVNPATKKLVKIPQAKLMEPVKRNI